MNIGGGVYFGINSFTGKISYYIFVYHGIYPFSLCIDGSIDHRFQGAPQGGSVNSFLG